MADAGKLIGQTAIVTGASEGIAEAIARRFAREGAKVAVVSRSLVNTKRVADGIERDGGTALALQADVTRSADVTQMARSVVDAWGGIDILVNGVGGFEGKAPMEEIGDREWN